MEIPPPGAPYSPAQSGPIAPPEREQATAGRFLRSYCLHIFALLIGLALAFM